MGDFNEIVSNHEKQRGRLRDNRQMNDFCNALEDSGLQDTGYKGCWYT